MFDKTFHGDPTASQHYVRGNVAIIPQDSVHLRQVLPPSSEDIVKAVCTVFVGKDSVVSRANVAKISPILCSKHNVQIMIQFLVANNPWYRVGFSQENLDALYDGPSSHGVPAAIQLNFLPSERVGETASCCADHTDREENLVEHN
ncbi:hypothetical protein SERLADRAFT_454761, partial [Serpula lacrymans var. lacrymans S7.9]